MNLHREPLVHFLVLGGLIFATFALVDDDPVKETRERIEVTEADAARLARQFAAAVGRLPGETELSDLIDGHIREEVLVREAQALSLDADDEIVRQRLVQKMQFVLEGTGDAVVPTEADLEAHFAENGERFAVAPMVAFEQLQLDPDAEQADSVLAAVRSGSDPARFALTSPLPRDIPPVPRQVVDGTFGEGFFDRLAGLAIGQWSGPINSSYGLHLVRVTLVEPGRQPPFEEIRAQVEQDWRRVKAQRQFEELLSRYDIVRPGATDVPPR